MNLLHARKALARPSATGPQGRAISFLPAAMSHDVAIVLGLVVLFSVARANPPLSGVREVIAWGAALIFTATFTLGTFRPLPLAIALCGACGVAMQAVQLGNTGYLMAIVTIIQASRLAVQFGPAIALATGVGYEASAILTAPSFEFGGFFSSALGLIFAYLAASSFRRLREEKSKTEALLQEVLAGRDAQVRAATLDERARIAREIHDILAHTLSALAVQLEGTRLLVEQRPGDPATLAAVERASGLARDGLEETRRAVGALRGDALPGPERLPGLVSDFERDTGIPSHLCIEGEPPALTPEARLALYRTAQEALTNVRKHAIDASVEVSLRYGAHEAELTVENQGAPSPSPLKGGGHGLSGMRERAELARGRLEAGPTPAGFRVRLWLPV